MSCDHIIILWEFINKTVVIVVMYFEFKAEHSIILIEFGISIYKFHFISVNIFQSTYAITVNLF